MAGNSTKYTFQVSADTTQAKKDIDDLLKTLNKVQQHSLDNFSISADLTNAAEAAKQLGVHLRAATNVNTGQLDLSKFNTSIEKAGSSLEDLITKLAMGGQSGAAAFDALTASIAKAQVPLRQTNAMLQNIATTLKNTVKWELSSSLVHGLEGALSGAVSYAKNLNSSLTDIRIVTGATVEQMADFTKQANIAAKELSTSTKAYADASLIYYQQGDNAETVAKKTAITLKAANTSFNTTASKMSEYLTAVWNSYQVGADELERYVDIMAALGAKTATSLEEIATSMQKVAATGNTVGVSMEQVSSIIATVSSVTRESAESIGTSYKTIFARMGDLKLGETLDDGVTLDQVSSTLEKIGVEVLDTNGDLRDMGDIVADLGDKWQGMNKAQKTAVAQVVAGKRQYTQLMALFENWDMYKENMAIAEGAEGSLQEMADVYAESWEAASSRTTASMEKIFNQLINDQGMIKMTNSVNSIIEGISGAIESLGSFNGVLSLTSSLMMKAFSSQIGASIKNIGNSIKNLFVSPKEGHLKTSMLAQTALENNNIKEQTNGYIQLVEVKNRLLQQEQYMSEAQKQDAEAMISYLQQQVTEIKTLEDSYVNITESIQAMNITTKSIGKREYSNLAFDEYIKQQKQQIEQIQQQYNLLQQGDSYEGLALSYQKANQLYHAGSLAEGRIADSQMTGLSDIKQFERIKSSAQQIQEAVQNTKYPQSFIDDIKRIADMDSTAWIDKDANDKMRILDDLRQKAKQLSDEGFEGFTQLETVFSGVIQYLRQLGVADEELIQLGNSFNSVGAAGQDMAVNFQKLNNFVNDFTTDVKRMNNSLDDSEFRFEKAFEGIFELGSGALDLVNEFSSISNLIARWGDESTTTADKIGGLGSSILSLGMALPSLSKGLQALFTTMGGPMAMAISVGLVALTGAAGVISGTKEANEKAEKEFFEKRQSKLSDNYNAYTEEISGTQELLSNYISLYNAFKAGDDVQQELISSAQSLAEAYGLTANSVAMASGNFTDFNNQIKETLNFTKELQELDSLIWSSGQQIERQEIDLADTNKTFTDWVKNAGIGKTDDGRILGGINQSASQRSTSFEDLSIVDFLYDTIRTQGNTGNGYLNTFFQKALSFSDSQIEALGIRPDDIIQQFFGDRYLEPYADVYNKVQTMSKEELVGLFGDSTVSDLFDLSQIDSKTLSQVESIAATSGLITGIQGYDIAKLLDDGIQNNLIQQNYDPTYNTLDYQLQWDNEASTEEKIANYKKFANWKAQLLEAQANTGDEFLKGFYDQLITSIETITEDETLKTNVNIYEGSKEKQKILETVQNNMSKLLSGDIVDFDSYIQVYNEILAEIDKSQDSFTVLKGLAPGTEEYIKARQQIADSIMTDFAGLDKFKAIYDRITANWHELDWAEAAQKIAGLGITDAEQLTSTIISAIKTGDDEVGKYLEWDQKGQKATEALSQYEDIPEYKAGMDFADAEAIASAYNWGSIDELSGIRIKSWEEFTKMETSARADYLESLNKQMKESALQTKREEHKFLKGKYDDDKSAFDTTYGDNLQVWQTEYDDFVTKTGGKVELGLDGSTIHTSFGEDDSQLRTQYESYSQDKVLELLQFGQAQENLSAQEINLESLDALIKAYELMGDTIDETAIKMAEVERHQQNLNVNFNALPQKGTAAWTRLSQSVQKYIKDYKSLDTLSREDQIKTIGDAQIAAAQEARRLFVGSVDWTDEADYEENMQKLGELDDAIDTARKGKQQGLLNIEVEKVDKAIAAAEKVISDLEKTAEQAQEKADILGSAIEIGELTEEQKASAGLTETEISDWEIADAQKRAQIAANAYSQAYIAERAVLDKQQQDILSAQSLFPEGKTLDVSKFFDTETGALKDISTLLAENIFGSNLTDGAKKALSDVWSTISGSINQSSTNTDIISLITGALTDDNDEISKALLVLAGQYKDTVVGAFSGVAQQMMDEAQSAADAWMDAFEQIAEARQKLFKGESLLDDIAGDPAKLLQYALAAGMTPEELTSKVFAGDLEGEDLKYPDYQKFKDNQMAMYSLDQKTIEGIAFGSKNKYMDTRALGYKDSHDGWVDAEGNKVEQAAINAALEEYYTAILQATGITEKEARAHAQEIIAGTREYKELSTARQGLVASIDQSAKAQEARTAEQDALAQIKKASDLTKLEIDKETGKIEGTDEIASVMGKVGDYEEYTRLQEAISRAQDAKYAGESWESLDTADRELLKQYDIDFSNVDTAAVSCADALAACASAALALAQAAAGDAGFTKNADGVYERPEGYMVNGEYLTEEQGIERYGLGTWEELKGPKQAALVSPELTESIDTLEDASNQAQGQVEDTSYSNLERMAGSVDMTVEEFESLKTHLKDIAKNTELTEEEFNEITKTVAKHQQGLKELNSTYATNAKNLKELDEGNTDYVKSMNQMKKQISKIFNTDESFISDKFVKENLDNLEKLANGTEEEAERAAEALSDNLVNEVLGDQANQEINIDVNSDGVVDGLDTISGFFDTFMDQYDNLEVGANINTGPAIDALNSLLMTGQMTAAQITAALNAIHWAPQITFQEMTIDEWQAATGSTTLPQIEMVNGYPTVVGTTTVPITSDYDGSSTVRVPVIGSGGLTKIGGGGGGGSSGGGGGGGGKKPQKKDHKRPQDVIERYHKNNSTIDQVSNALEKLEKEKDRAYGKDYVDKIDEETAALQRQLAAQEALRAEAESYVNIDGSKLIAAGAILGEDGVIQNYDALVQSWIDDYNAAVDAWNSSAQKEGDEEDFKEAEQLFEDRMQMIEDYEEALQTMADAEAEIEELRNQMSENALEKITYTLELNLEVNERDVKFLDYLQGKYEGILDQQDELFSSLMQEASEYESNFAVLQQAYDDLVSDFYSGTINETHFAEGLEEIHSQMLENLESMQEIKDEIAEVYTNTLELAAEEIDNANESFEHMNETMQSFITIMGLAGRETDFKELQVFYDAQYANNLDRLNVQTAHLAALREEEARFREKIEQDGELTDLEKEQYEALQEQIRETQSVVLATTEETLEALQAGYENTINGIAQDLDEFMAGSAGSLAHLADQYAYFQQEQERYVSTAKELSEVSKLNRDIEGTLATTTSAASKEALKALQEKINKQSELNQLTEYDIEMNQLEYQLLLARIQLEESQNAKDTVRLTRDDNGNYAYQYTADQNKVDEAMQNYEDTLQQMNDLTAQRTSEIEQGMINSMQEYQSKMQEIALDTTLTEEEKYARMEELYSQFSATMAYWQEQGAIATENLTYNQEAIAEHYGVNMSEITASTAGNVNEQIQSMIQNAQQYSQAMHDALFGEEGVSESWADYLAAVANVTTVSGTSYGNMLEGVAEMGAANEETVQAALDTIDALSGTLEPIAEMTDAWNAHAAALEATISQYEALVNAVNEAMATLGETDAAGGIQTPAGSNTRGGQSLAIDEGYEELSADILDFVADYYKGDMEQELSEVISQYKEEYLEIANDAQLSSEQRNEKLNELMEQYTDDFLKMQEDNGELTEEGTTTALEAYKDILNQINDLTEQSMLSNYSASGMGQLPYLLIDQNVTITAEFPNATDEGEIIEAFTTLINRAAQLASTKNL